MSHYLNRDDPRSVIDSTTIPLADGHRKPGAYIIDQYGRTLVMGTETRYVVKARMCRPRRNGRIKF